MSGSCYTTQQSNSGDVKEDRGEVEDGNARMTEKRKIKGGRTAKAMRTTMGERMTW